jgi:hypothetical protein
MLRLSLDRARELGVCPPPANDRIALVPTSTLMIGTEAMLTRIESPGTLSYVKRPHSNWPVLAKQKLEKILRACPSCGATDAQLDPIISPLLSREEKGYTGSGGGLPSMFLLPVSCPGCAHVRFFDAERLGLMV